jgi:hypothetical protein
VDFGVSHIPLVAPTVPNSPLLQSPPPSWKGHPQAGLQRRCWLQRLRRQRKVRGAWTRSKTSARVQRVFRCFPSAGLTPWPRRHGGFFVGKMIEWNDGWKTWHVGKPIKNSLPCGMVEIPPITVARKPKQCRG